MKVKAIHRSIEDSSRDRAGDLRKVHRNLDPDLHPLERAVEAKRALSAAKLGRVFAAPFIASFAHDDGVTCLAKSPATLNCAVAGVADGTLAVWDLAGRRRLRTLARHPAAVTGVAVLGTGDALVSCSVDGAIRAWRLPFAPPTPGPAHAADTAVAQWDAPGGGARGLDAHPRRGARFASGGPAGVALWDTHRSAPVAEYAWGADGMHALRFSPAEPDLLVGCGGDRSLAIYDVRSAAGAVRKIIMQTKANAAAWNPMEPLNFVAASEDCNLYTYDMRNLTTSLCVHQDFVSSVTSVDFSPTGREFVAGGYDRSVRSFGARAGHARDAYTGKRMQRVSSVLYSADAAYVISGSDDFNVRLWKARAAEQMGVRLPREKAATAYAAALVARYKHLPDVRKVTQWRRLPAPIYKAAKARRAQIDAEARKTRRRVQHSAPGSVVVKPERRKKIVAELE
jgi:DDB1- and CUL4-associated factor 13